MDLDFNVYWYGPNQWDIPDWIGTITFDGEDTEYGMAFFAFSTGKPFETQNPGMAYFFGEIWAIYDWVELVTIVDDEGNLLDQYLEHGDLLMWGYDYGVTIGANTKYHMNGDVQLDELFGEYAGRHVHMNGAITYYTEGDLAGVPNYTYGGQFRVN